MTKDKIKIVIGENVRKERVARNISLDELAEMLGLSPGFVGLIERGQRGATANTLFNLSRVFGMSIDNFFYEDQSSPLSLGEDSGKLKVHKEVKHMKIESLIFDFSDPELDFIISIIKGIRIMNRSRVDDSELSDEDEVE